MTHRAAFALVAVLALTACGGEADAPRAGTTLQELTGDRSGAVDIDSARVGSSISLQAPVARKVGGQSFEIAAEEGGSGRPVLVLQEENTVEVGQVVQVIGRVDVLTGSLAREYGVGTEPTGQLVVVASEIDTDVLGDGV